MTTSLPLPDVGSWTRSIQRVEGIGVVVDIRPLSNEEPQLSLHQTAPSGTGTIPFAFGGRAYELTSAYARDHFAGEIDGKTITMRLDTAMTIGPNDAAGCFTRALRAHLAGVKVEVMGLIQTGRPATLMHALGVVDGPYWVTVKGSGGRRPVTVPARIVATSHKTGKVSIDGYGWTSTEYITRWYRPIRDDNGNDSRASTSTSA